MQINLALLGIRHNEKAAMSNIAALSELDNKTLLNQLKACSSNLSGELKNISAGW